MYRGGAGLKLEHFTLPGEVISSPAPDFHRGVDGWALLDHTDKVYERGLNLWLGGGPIYFYRSTLSSASSVVENADRLITV